MDACTIRPFALAALAAVLLGPFAPGPRAQVVLDGTLGRAGALSGPNFAVGADLGRQVGANLFHSFSQFGLAQGQTATFSGPAGIANVVSRVTGGNASSIDGRILSTIAGADFFLFNPAGIGFGPNASIDVGGAFHASSAHQVRLADGGRFDAANPSASTLTAAAPAAFGFLGGQGALIVQGARLETPTRAALTITGGDVGVGYGARLVAPGGVGIASVAGAGEVAIARDGIGRVDGARGTVVLLEGGVHAPSEAGLPSGPVRIVGGDIAIAGDSSVTSANYSEANGGGITIDATGLLLISNGWVATDSYAFGGSAGDIRVTAPSLVLEDGSSLLSNTFGPARSGNVDVAARDLLVTGSSRINASSWGEGDAGMVRIAATGSVALEDRGNISATAWSGGRSGDIEVRADTLSIDTGFIASTTWDVGRGGTVTLDVGDLRLNDGFVSASSSLVASGAAGDVNVRASRSVAIEGFMGGLTTSTYSGEGGNILVTTPLMTLGPDGFVTSRTMGTGNAGSVRLVVGDLALREGAYLSADTSSDASGRGGSIDIRASGTVTVASGAFGGILASTLGSGDGGSIAIDAARLDVLDGKIDAVTQGSGNAGSIAIRASDRVLVDAGRLTGGIETSSRGTGSGGSLEIVTPELVIRRPGGLAAYTSDTGAGGVIRIEADRVFLEDGGQIRSYTLGSGRAGTLDIHAGEIGLSTGAQILAYTTGEGAGGDVSLRGDRLIRIAGEGGAQATTGIYASSEATGAGGSIRVAAPVVELSDTGFLIAGTRGPGAGGSVAIEAGDVRLSSLAFVDVSSYGSGPAGSLSLDATGRVELAGSVGSDLATGLFGGAADTGRGGSIVIRAPQVLLEDGATASSVTFGEGRGGSIRIEADELVVRDRGAINATSYGAGAAGDIVVRASRSVRVEGAAGGEASGIGAESNASGAGGRVDISAPVVDVRDGAVIAARGFGTGDAGTIRIEASERLSVSGGADIVTRTMQSDGGDIRVEGAGVVWLHGGSITTSVQGGAGNGGNIAIAGPQHVVLDGGTIQANAYGGNGGNITIDSAYFIASPGSLVEASSQLGVSGTITVTAPVVDVGAGLGALPAGFFDASRLLREACASRAGESENSFVVVGRGEMPESAWGALGSPGRRERAKAGATAVSRADPAPCAGAAR